MTKQTKTNKLNYLIDPTVAKVKRLFALSIKMEDDRIFLKSIKHQVLK